MIGRFSAMFCSGVKIRHTAPSKCRWQGASVSERL